MLLAYIGELERRLIAASKLVVCSTEEDGHAFEALSASTLVVPDGCDLTPAAQRGSGKLEEMSRRVGFMGSAHAPNIRAACFIRDELAAAFPAVQFEALGSVCVELTGALLPNLVARGVVDDFLNSEILRSWDIALNPVATGGGSSLKLPDYLAHGLPP